MVVTTNVLHNIQNKVDNHRHHTAVILSLVLTLHGTEPCLRLTHDNETWPVKK